MPNRARSVLCGGRPVTRVPTAIFDFGFDETIPGKPNLGRLRGGRSSLRGHRPQDLNVRRYAERASKIINLRDSDIGRPLSDLTTSLEYSALQDDAHETLRTLVFSEKQILDRDGRWFLVRIMPYRQLDNVIDGAVITFVDITAIKQLESSLRQAADP